MAKRLQVDPTVGEAALTPTAAPVSTYYQPKVPQPVYQAVTDLSGLSASLARVGQQMATREADIQRTEALRFAQAPENADLVKEVSQATTAQDAAQARRDVNQKAAQRLVRSGKMSVSENPWLEPAFQEVGAGEVMAQYNQELQSRLSEVSLVLDPKTGLPTAPQSAEKIMQDTWQKYGSNPILASYYGAQVANKNKAAIDEGFRAKASAKLQDAKQQGLEDITTKQLSTFSKQFVGKPMTPEDASQITETMKRLNLLGFSPEKQTGILLQMVKSGQMYAETVDAATARQFLSDMEKVQLPQGGTLADHPELQSYMDNQISILSHREDADRSAKYKLESEQLSSNTSTVVNESIKAISDARAQGQEITFQDWQAKQPADRFGIPTQRIYTQARNEVERMLAIQYDDTKAMGTMEDALHQPGMTPENLNDLLTVMHDKLRPETRSRYQDQIDQRKNAVKSLQDVPVWQDGPAQLEKLLSANLGQISESPEGLVAYGKGQDIVTDAKAQLLSMAALHDPTDKKGMQEEGTKILQAAKTTMQTYTAQAVKDHTELSTKIQRAIEFRSNEAKTLIDGSNGVLSAQEMARMRGQLVEAQTAERNFYESDSGPWRTRVYGYVLNQLGAEPNPINPGHLTSEQMDQADEIMVGARTAAKQALSQWRADPNADPADFQTVALEAGAKYVRDAIHKNVAESTPEAKAKLAAEAETKQIPQDMAATWTAATNAGNDKLAADAFTRAVADPARILTEGQLRRVRSYIQDPSNPDARAYAIARISEAADQQRANPAGVASLSPLVPMTTDDVLSGRMVVPYAAPERVAWAKDEFAKLDATMSKVMNPKYAAAFKAQVARDGVYNPDAPAYRGLKRPVAFGVEQPFYLPIVYSDSYQHRWVFLNRLANEPGMTYDIKGQLLSPFTYLSDVPDWNAYAKANPDKATQIAKAFGLASPEEVGRFQQIAKNYQH